MLLAARLASRRHVVARHALAASCTAGARKMVAVGEIGRSRRAFSTEAREEAAAASPEAVKEKAPEVEPTKPWHEFSPRALAIVNTCGNLCALTAAATSEHLFVRLFAGSAALHVFAFNVLMPKPLKTHQITAASWGMVFALLHLMNMAWVLRERMHVTMDEETEEIYNNSFQKFGVTPRQFAMLLKAGPAYKDYEPGEIISKHGEPVNKVRYLVSGSCRSVKSGTAMMDYPVGVWLGTMLPERWVAEHRGDGKKLEEMAEKEAKEKEAFEAKQRSDRNLEQWLRDKANVPSKADGVKPERATTRERRDMSEILEEGLKERLGNLTAIAVGATWKTTVEAGDKGCRVMEWPVGTFVNAVGSEEKLAEAMKKFNEHSLAAKISSGTSQFQVDSYKDLMACCVADGVLDPAEKMALLRFRQRNSIRQETHLQVLESMGWTEEEYDAGILQHKVDSMVHTWVSKSGGSAKSA